MRTTRVRPSRVTDEFQHAYSEDVISRTPGRSRVNGPGRRIADAVSMQSLTTSERAAVGAKSFEIVVKGRLSPTLTAAIDGFEVIRCDHGLTHLVGWVPDQARLHSTLELLRDLNIELISVNQSDEPDALDPRFGTTRGDSIG
jgi:hypothetical protein